MPWLAAIGGQAAVTSVVTSADKPFTIAEKAGWFNNGQYTNLQSINAAGLDVSAFTTIEGMFRDIARLTTVTGLDGWDVDGIASYAFLFEGDTRLSTVSGLSAWADKTAALTDLHRMFYNCTSMKEIGRAHV